MFPGIETNEIATIGNNFPYPIIYKYSQYALGKHYDFDLYSHYRDFINWNPTYHENDIENIANSYYKIFPHAEALTNAYSMLKSQDKFLAPIALVNSDIKSEINSFTVDSKPNGEIKIAIDSRDDSHDFEFTYNSLTGVHSKYGGKELSPDLKLEFKDWSYSKDGEKFWDGTVYTIDSNGAKEGIDFMFAIRTDSDTSKDFIVSLPSLSTTPYLYFDRNSNLDLSKSRINSDKNFFESWANKQNIDIIDMNNYLHQPEKFNKLMEDLIPNYEYHGGAYWM